MNKSAIVFGGTHDHIHLVRLLKDRGFEVVLFDNTPSPAAQKYCCKKIKLNFSHLCGARKECLKINPSLALAISVDRAIPVAAYISESLNLPFYITDDTAAILSDKVEIKDRLRASGIPTADYYRDFDKNINKLKYPLIVKPVDANSSKGVMRVDEYSHLSRAIEYAREISQSNKVLIEEFIIGDEYSIDAVVQDGKTRVITITKVNKLPNANKFVINENIFSIRTHKRLLKQASTLVSAICKTFRLENSPLLIQAILNKDGQLMVVELSARVGGGSKHHLIRKVTGFDIIDWCLHMILGENYQINPNYTINYCSITYLYGNCGIISKIHLPDDVKQNTFLYKNVDAEIGGSDNSSDRVAGVMSVGGTLRELKLNQRKLISQINITNKAGERLLEINSH